MVFPRANRLALLGEVEQRVVHLEGERGRAREHVAERDGRGRAGLHDEGALGFRGHARSEQREGVLSADGRGHHQHAPVLADSRGFEGHFDGRFRARAWSGGDCFVDVEVGVVDLQ